MRQDDGVWARAESSLKLGLKQGGFFEGDMGVSVHISDACEMHVGA